MLAANGPQWFDRTPPDTRWSSIGVSIVVTAAMFAAAFAAMHSVSGWINVRAADHEVAVVVHLALPAPLPTTRRHPLSTTVPRARSGSVVPEFNIAPLTAIPIRVVPVSPAVSAAHVAPSTMAFDSSVARGTESSAPAAAGSGAVQRLRGAPVAPAGVTMASRMPINARFRDSVARVQMSTIPELAMTHRPSGAELAELQQTQRADDMLHGRTTSAGRAVGNPHGQGIGGVGAVGPGSVSAGAGGTTNIVLVSIPFPLFYPGPSPEQRRRDSIVHADNMARLERLKARADSLARTRIVP
jgi:hypothetical protein